MFNEQYRVGVRLEVAAPVSRSTSLMLPARKMYVFIVSQFRRVWINRVWLAIVLVVS